MNKPNRILTGAASQVNPEDMSKKKMDQANAAADKPGTPQTYESAGQYGSGFVNLSHLLNLNQASGFNSAKDLARRTEKSGMDAWGGIDAATGQFNKDVAGAEVNAADYMAPDFTKGSSSVQGMIDKANQGYKGPNDLTQQSGYADLSKKVSGAQDMAKNAAGGGYGLAAQIGKETGQSATQANAGAFYMGVNNGMTKRAGEQFKNLGAALDEANANAMARSSSARQNTANAPGILSDYENRRNDYYHNIDVADARERALRPLLKSNQESADADYDLQHKHTDPNDPNSKVRHSEVMSAGNQADENKRKGMDGGLADHGMTYDEWVALGYPDSNSEAGRKWMHDHGYDSYYGDAGNGGV